VCGMCCCDVVSLCGQAHTWYVLEKQKQKDINKEKEDDDD
jgi:hypothetical protein